MAVQWRGNLSDQNLTKIQHSNKQRVCLNEAAMHGVERKAKVEDGGVPIDTIEVNAVPAALEEP